MRLMQQVVFIKSFNLSMQQILLDFNILPLISGDKIVPHWRSSGTTVVNKNFIRLTPDRQSKKGALWSRRLLFFELVTIIIVYLWSIFLLLSFHVFVSWPYCFDFWFQGIRSTKFFVNFEIQNQWSRKNFFRWWLSPLDYPYSIFQWRRYAWLGREVFWNRNYIRYF